MLYQHQIIFQSVQAKNVFSEFRIFFLFQSWNLLDKWHIIYLDINLDLN
jgi:hypothetical protein